MVDSPTHAVWRRLERLPAFARAADPTRPQWHVADLLAACGLVGIATLLRLLADPFLPSGFPYLTFFPTVILSAFIWGTPAGMIAALLGGLSAWYFFIPPSDSFSMSQPIAVALGFYALVTTIDLGLIHFSIRAYGEQARIRRQLLKLAEEKQLIDREIDHRVKNLFSLFSALISLSQRESATPADMGERLRGRIIAMSRSHSMLRISPDGVVALGPALAEALSPFGVGTTLAITGPSLRVPGEAALHLSMVMFELGTNAAKYVALSRAEGRIDLRWQQEGDPDAGTLRFDWRESGGAPPDAHAVAGFGSELCRRLVEGLGGTMAVEGTPGGLVARLTFPSASLRARHSTANA